MINPRALRVVFTDALRLTAAESCLIVADTAKEPIGRALYETACLLADRTILRVMAPTAEHAAEPPPAIAAEMLRYDVLVLVTEHSLTHTQARRAASAAGKRIATMPGITEAIANRCLDIDYEALRRDSRRLTALVNSARRVRVTTAAGTDIWFDPSGSLFFGHNGGIFDVPGAYGNLPEGEVSFSPAASEGVYVVDASFPGLGILERPLRFTVRDCRVCDISGAQADRVRQRLERAGPAAFYVAELGIGLNDKACITGVVLEDEKVRGTAHIAVGNNCSYGRNNAVPLHLDGVLTKPDIYCDDTAIMSNGRFVSGLFD